MTAIRAAVACGPGAPFSVQDAQLDAPRDDEVLVRMVAAGICHTDLLTRQRHPGPIVLGHEGAGVVEAVGPRAGGLAPGDHVLLSFRSCRACASCAAGRPASCERMDELNSGGTRPDGSPTVRDRDGAPVAASFFGQSSFATHALASASNAVRVGPDVDLVAAAPLGCSVQTGAGAVLEVLRPPAGSSLAVFGAGAVGLSAVMAARATGLDEVVVVDPLPQRRELALELGATRAVEPAERLRGLAFAVEATGRPEAIAAALRAVGRRGVVAVCGLGAREATIDAHDLLLGSKTLRGVIEGDADPLTFLPRLLDLGLPVERLVARYPFEEIERAADDLRAGRVVKPVLTF